MFENFIAEKFEGGANYSFDYKGISCQVNEYMDSVYNYMTELYFGDKYLRWGRENGEQFTIGDMSVTEDRKFFEAFIDYFDYALPRA